MAVKQDELDEKTILILRAIANGRSYKQILEDNPELTLRHIQSAAHNGSQMWHLSQLHANVLQAIAEGASYEQILIDNPCLSYKDIFAAASQAVYRDERKLRYKRYLEKTREEYPNAFRHWNPEDDDQLLRMRNEGKSDEDIAAHFGRSPRAITSRIARLTGEEPEKPPVTTLNVPKLKTAEELESDNISEQLKAYGAFLSKLGGASESVNKKRRTKNQKTSPVKKNLEPGAWDARLEEMRKVYPNAYRNWTSEEESRLVELYKQGIKMNVISKLLGRQPGAVKSRLVKLGLINEI